MTSLGYRYKYFEWSLRAALIVVMLSIFLNFTGINANAIDWGDPNLDDGVSMFFEQKQPFISKPGNRILRFKYPMVQNGSVTFKLQKDGTDLIQFMDSVSADGDLSLDNATYTLINASGIITINDEKWYMEGDRRVIELNVDFTEGCIPTYVGHSNMDGTEGDTNGSFSVSLTPGDAGDVTNKDMKVDTSYINSKTMKVDAQYYGYLKGYKWIFWNAWIDHNNDDQLTDDEKLPLSDITFSSDYTHASYLNHAQADGGFPASSIEIKLSNIWAEGAIENPSFDPTYPAGPEGDGDIGGSGDESNIQVLIPDYIDWGDTEIHGEAYRVYAKDSLPIKVVITGYDNYDIEWSLIRKAAFELTGPQFDDPTWIDHEGVVNNLGRTGGSISIADEGFYLLVMTVKDSKDGGTQLVIPIRVYLPPVAVFVHADGKPIDNWDFEISQEILVTGKGSYGRDLWGPAWHEINHDLDVVTIEPLDSQGLDSIYILKDDKSDFEELLKSGNKVVLRNSSFKATNQDGFRSIGFDKPGRYKVTYTITNYGGRTGTTEVTLNIMDITQPIIQASVPDKVFRTTGERYADVKFSGPKTAENPNSYVTISTIDGTPIENFKVLVIYDSNNDGIYSVDDLNVDFASSGIKDGIELSIEEKESYTIKKYYDISLRSENIGGYKIVLSCNKKISGSVLPGLAIPDIQTATLDIYTEIDNTAPSALYNIQPIQKVDVVLALGELSQQQVLKDSIPTLRSKLNAKGNYIDAVITDVATSILDSTAVSPEKIFRTWVNYPGTSYGFNYDAGWQLAGDAIQTTKNVNWTGYWDPQYTWVTDAIYEFDMTYGGHQDPMGWTIRMNKNGNSYSYYAIEVAPGASTLCVARIDSWVPGNYATHGGPLYHRMINGQDGTYGDAGQYGQATSYQGARGQILGVPVVIPSVNGHYKIENTGNNIKVYKDGVLYINVTDNSGSALRRGSFGPYTCSQFTTSFRNMKVTMGADKSLGEAVSDVQWRDGSARFVIHATDIIPPDFKDLNSSEYAYTLATVLQSNAYVANLGTPTNQARLSEFIEMLRGPRGDDKAIFINNNPMAQAVDKTGDWIIEIVRRMRQSSDFVLVGSPVAWETTYSDDNADKALNDNDKFNATDKLQAEKWRYNHDPNWFDNKLRTEAYSNLWIKDPVSVFNNPGKFKINYKRKDNPFDPNVDLDMEFNGYRYWSQDYDAKSSGLTNAPDKLGTVEEVIDIGQLSRVLRSTTVFSNDVLESEVDNKVSNDVKSVPETIITDDTPEYSGSDVTEFISNNGIKASDVDQIKPSKSSDDSSQKPNTDSVFGSNGLLSIFTNHLLVKAEAVGFEYELSAVLQDDKIVITSDKPAESDIELFIGKDRVGIIKQGGKTVSIDAMNILDDSVFRMPDGLNVTSKLLLATFSWDKITENNIEFTIRAVVDKDEFDIKLVVDVLPTGYKILKNGKDFKDLSASDNSFKISIRDMSKTDSFSIKAIYGPFESIDAIFKYGSDLFYTSKANPDEQTIAEDNILFADFMSNDTHDDRYDIPNLKSVKVISGDVIAEIVKREDIPNASTYPHPEYIKISPAKDWNGVAKIEYVYDKVRSDFDPIKSTVTATFTPVNDAPVATDVTRDSTDYLGAISDTVIEIEAKKILEFVTDVDTPSNKLSISYVGRCSAGEVSLSDKKIVLKPFPGFYGLIQFEYQASDGESESLPAIVHVWISKADSAPIAVEVIDSINLEQGKKRLSLSQLAITNGHTVHISNYRNFELNGIATNQFSVNTVYAEEDEFTDVVLKDKSQFVAGDVITFDYSASALDDPKLVTSSRVELKIESTGTGTDNEGILYVHRQPVAKFTPNVSLDSTGKISGVSITKESETSFDYDHSLTDSVCSDKKSFSLKGVRTWNWAIRTVTGSWESNQFDADDFGGRADSARDAGIEWINNKLAEYAASDKFNTDIVYLLLSVRDIDGSDNIGVWSNDEVFTITNKKMKPFALFDIPSELYYVETENPNFEAIFSVTDRSYSPMGRPIVKWRWIFTTPEGQQYEMTATDKADAESRVRRLVSDQVNQLFRNSNYKPKTPFFKVSLEVTDDQNQKSSIYAKSFRIYRKNKAPVIVAPDDSQLSDLTSATLYLYDKAEDGVVGDDFGIAGNTVKRGNLDFSKLFSISDDQLNTVKVDYVFSGQAVKSRATYRNEASAQFEKAYSGLGYNVVPFTHTVTDEGFKPGAYKITVVAVDNPDEAVYGDYASETSILETKPDDKPYHLYVVPSLYVIPHYQFGDWVDGKYNVKTGQTLEESGLTAEDIAPCTGDIVTIFADCNQYVTGVSSYRDLNKNGKYDEGDDMVVEMERGSSNPDGTIRWSVDVELEEVPDPIGEEILTHLEYGVTATTIWGSETGDVMRSKYRKLDMDAMATKLYDFNIQYVTDPDISTELADFIKEDANRIRLGGATVGDLAVAKDVFTVLPRKGYSFYFEIWSKGLTKDNDWVRITPKFYAIDLSDPNNPKVGTELTGYLQVKDKSWKSFQDKDNEELAQLYPVYYEGEKVNKLGSHAELNLPITLRSIEGTAQRWKGRYGLPSGSRFAPVGMDLTDSTEYKGDILICMNFKAVKKGVERVDYVGRRQWSKERELYKNDSKGFFVDLENSWRSANNNIGTIIVYDGIKNVEDEYSVSPTWKD